MADQAHDHRHLTLDEFLDWDDGTDRRYELVAGEPVAMAPPSEAHAGIAANLIGELRVRLRRPCRVLSEAGVVFSDQDDAYFQADVVVSCSPSKSGSRHATEPVLIAEVFSPSTAGHDRGVKGVAYRQIPSVRELLFVSSDEPRVELWHRADGDRWVVEDLIGSGVARLESLDIALPLSAIYQDITF